MGDDSGIFEACDGDRVTGMFTSGRMRLVLRLEAIAEMVERKHSTRPPPPDEEDPETLDIEPDPPSAA